MEIQHFKQGSVIFNENDPGTTMFLIRSGKVKVMKKVRGVEKTLAVFGPGEFFGEMAVITGKPRSATAIAQEDSQLQVLDREAFLKMVQSDPQERMPLMVLEKLCERLRATDQQIENLLIGDHLNRVADALIRTESALTPGELAESVGLPKDRVQGLLKKLEAAGVVSLAGGRIQVVDSRRLENYREMQTQVVDARGEIDTLRIHKHLKSTKPGTWLVILVDTHDFAEETRRLAESRGCRVLEALATGEGEWQVTVET